MSFPRSMVDCIVPVKDFGMVQKKVTAKILNSLLEDVFIRNFSFVMSI